MPIAMYKNYQLSKKEEEGLFIHAVIISDI